MVEGLNVWTCCAAFRDDSSPRATLDVSQTNKSPLLQLKTNPCIPHSYQSYTRHLDILGNNDRKRWSAVGNVNVM